MTHTRTPEENLARLRGNPYPGRGIVVGLDETSKYLVQVYWIMGRSENSRNRVFKSDPRTGRLYTEAADVSKMKDASLVIYSAMLEYEGHYVVSNGDQTNTVVNAPSQMYLNVALYGRKYEPDAPNFTQRITAMTSLNNDRPLVQMSILRKSPLGDTCDHVFYECRPYPGCGHCITTYAHDGNPLPSFRGDPLVMPLVGDMQGIANTYWQALNEENRVSLAVKFIDIEARQSDIWITNKYNQV